MDLKLLTDNIINEVRKVIIDKDDIVKLVLSAVLSGGHVLLDDVPGVGKTTLVKTLSFVLGIDYGRIQFVPDMLPSDITGMNIYNQKTMEFEFKAGPVVTNLLLADEINRAIPRTQSALLEVMEERQITIDGRVLTLPKPFMVIATQNPVDSENTFPLPAAQMDRFMIRTSIGYPSKEGEINMLKSSGNGVDFSVLNKITDAGKIIEAGEVVSSVKVSDHVMKYIYAIIEGTRTERSLKVGASPRATKALFRASKCLASMEGRDFVKPDDVKKMAVPVLAHRLITKGGLKGTNDDAENILKGILEKTEASPDVQALYEASK